MQKTPRRAGAAHLASLALDPGASAPMHRQLYFGIRAAILEGRLRPGTRLPSTRTLARDLSVSRNTATAAFEQLIAEGYIEGKIGAGSFVSTSLPEDALNARIDVAPGEGGRRGPPIAERGRRLAELGADRARPAPFSPGLPELAAFPFEDWARMLARHWRRPKKGFLIGADPGGDKRLRMAIADYVGAARAVRCSPEQVFVVSGAQQALDIAARVLVDPGDRVWVEDPGYPGIIGALIAAGAELAPAPVDADGLDVEAGKTLAPTARMACVSPSHQFPLGVTMSLARRVALLEWARECDAFVLEDDYDSEYRYAGRPLAALQGLDADGRVVYVGTMSKVMFPGLRLGYLVVPEHLVDDFHAVRRLTDSHPSTIAQPALADFIAEGYFSAHIRRMRSLYAERQLSLVEAANRTLSGALDVEANDAGMHLVGRLAAGLPDRRVSEAARELGVEAPALSTFYRACPPRNGLLLGFAGVHENELAGAIGKLARAIETVARRR